MALPHGPIDDEMRKALFTAVTKRHISAWEHEKNYFLDMLEDARKNPTPHIVSYVGDAFYYASPKEYLWLPLHAVSPSACEWIVPGTLWDTSHL